MIKIGIDIGSTTIKVVALDASGEILFKKYERHHAKAQSAMTGILQELQAALGDIDAIVRITGSVGMGIAEQLGIPFVQEVVAAARAIQAYYPSVRSMIDIGGEDAKIVFFKDSKATDFRMNGNCAGGTGAFIDQMAVILGTKPDELSELALHATQLYPVASRCGVFCKTDIQTLIAKNVSREDIAASIFHAVAVQTIVTLARGCDIECPILFCGGPLTFIPALRKAFMEYLKTDENNIVLPENGALLPALGTALSTAGKEEPCRLSMLADRLTEGTGSSRNRTSGLAPIFPGEKEYEDWKKRMSSNRLQTAEFRPGKQDVFIGIDSGSTTTKIVVTDTGSRILYTYYSANNGNPVETVAKGLALLKEESLKHGTELRITGSCSTGYGEDLIKVAFQLDAGIVETIAHYKGAHYLNEEVSFILDIGGQDMKAVFVDKGVINRIEINEACSSGCGSFIETFARTLGYSAEEFAREACRSSRPCDLGTRCTVFMNSKVKQALREGASVNDIAAGLAYSVVKNFLYKVLKLKDVSVLGKHIVVQGGAMRNDAVVRALELLTGVEVTRCNLPELMGAFGCSLYAKEHACSPASLDDMLAKAHYTQSLLHCKGCENQCLVSRYRFDNGRCYYSGNRCEKVFANGDTHAPGTNAYRMKEQLLFHREEPEAPDAGITIGIPRCLNMYENYPFWHALFTACGMKVVLSEPSDFSRYEQHARMVMSDNICFPAKLVHSHVQELADKKVDRIFLPYVIFEKAGKGQNSYNCPIVTGYADVVKGVQAQGIPIDSPAISFKDEKLLYKQCCNYLKELVQDEKVIRKAFARAVEAQSLFEKQLADCNRTIEKDATENNRLIILLAGRPYHTDALIQHKVSDMIAGLGVDVITDDIVRGENVGIPDVHFLAQWAYPNRILQAAQWCAGRNAGVQFVEMTSFGCGPDAFLTDEVRDLLVSHGKPFTLLKLDDINNVGAMKLRVRSLIESLKLSQEQTGQTAGFSSPTPASGGSLSGKKILIPFFTPFISPLIPAVMHLAGYETENLPLSDATSCDYGLKYANNEICYPATLIVGDAVKAFKSGMQDPAKSVVAMTQTGGQCRASNYLSIIRKALADAGYPEVPVISLTLGQAIDGKRSGLKINWMKILPVALRTVLFSDCIAKFYHASAPREKEPGQAAALKDLCLNKADKLIRAHRSHDLFDLLTSAAGWFNEICSDKNCPRVGVVGEIYLKFNPFAHKNIIGKLTEKGIEAVPSALVDFFLQNFVNRQTRTASFIQKSQLPAFLYQGVYRLIGKQIEKANAIGRQFRYFIPFGNIFEEAAEAQKVISLNAQFGEGWLLPAEVLSLARQNIKNVVSLQPFGCIANHIVAKGIERRIKSLVPDINMLSLDFDSGVSEVNIDNRLLLFMENLKK